MRCPHHALPLVQQDSEGHVGAVCPKCHGTWVEYLKVVAIKSKRRFVPELFIEDLEAATTGPTKLKCPEDSEVLQAAAPLGVALDWCPSCYGVWFDNGELKKLLAMHPHHAEGTNVGVDSLVAGEAALEILFTALSLFK